MSRLELIQTGGISHVARSVYVHTRRVRVEAARGGMEAVAEGGGGGSQYNPSSNQ